MKTILVTGCAGFIGSNFVPYFLNKYPDVRLINLDLLTYAGDMANLADAPQNERHIFVQGDICDRPLVESLFVLIDVAYKSWMDKPFVYKSGYEECRFHHISTDEVYGTLSDDPKDLFTEETAYAPNSPYSASKAGSDMIVRSYHHTYGMNTVITNCSNNYGPKQHNEKLIPTVIRKALAGENIPVYGDGKNIRDWLYVLDHCKGIDLVYHSGRSGEVYNIGGRNERNNNQIVERICTLLDEMAPRHSRAGGNPASYKELISYVEDRAGHDRRYAIDATKLETELGWKAQETFDTGIVKTIEWYLKKYNFI
jgi:dTDP-glucose 4,6-dehydratase